MSKELNPRREIEPKQGIKFGFYFPKEFLTNEEIENWGVLTSHGHHLSAEAILKRTGVKRRYVASDFEDTLSMAISATSEILNNGYRNGAKPDFIFTSTCYASGVNLAGKLNDQFSLSAEPQDIFAACSGFVTALTHMKQNEAKYLGKRVLIASTERHQDKVFHLKHDGAGGDPSLSQTIFSDGAAAVLFTYGKDLTVLASTDKELGHSQALKIPHDRNQMIEPFLERPRGGIPLPESGKIEQQGKTVYSAVTRAIPELIRKTVSKARLEPEDIDIIIPHQASIHVLESLQERLSEYNEKIFVDIESGNFSSASIPKAMNKAMRAGKLGRGTTAVLAGFGAGLFSSVAVIKL